MDPLTTATTFATIVGLVGSFIGERRHQNSVNYDEFVDWLNQSRHADVIKILHESAGTAIAVKALLHESKAELTERLNSLDREIARIASAFEGISEIASALYPDMSFSDQAISLLDQFSGSSATKVLVLTYVSDDLELPFLDAPGGLSYTDPRFVRDDLESLADAGLLRKSLNGRGQEMFEITRRAIGFIRALGSRVASGDSVEAQNRGS